ncbi:DUF309 domain-containing protein [Halobacteriales archaeon SW_5_70_135]|nr:MAG: DUF309 domain-containing protein [Halobacteriales archaeon SW_5_70_135]
MRHRLRAGAAVYNVGHRHAAHDLWEDRWLDLRERLVEAGDDPPATAEAATPVDDPPVPSTAADERLLHGLIQFTAAAHHRAEGNADGARDLGESAGVYLGALPDEYRDCALAPVRKWLDALADDADAAPRPPPLRHEGTVVTLVDLDAESALLAAPVVAETTGYDPEPVAAAAEYARETVRADETSRFVALVVDFVTGDRRGVVYRRLSDHVDRRRRRDRDVDGLF